MRMLISALSEPQFGEDESDYFKRQMKELAGEIGLIDLREACRLKWIQLEVQRLIEALRSGVPGQEARDRAITLLLKEVFYL